MSGWDDTVLDKLVDLLEKGGLRIFRGEAKLTLPVCVLQRLNAALEQIDTYCTVPEGLQFLQEFVRRTPTLKVTRSQGLTARVDVSKFVSVRHLELVQIPICLVSGLDELRSRLEVLVCSGCGVKCSRDLSTASSENGRSLDPLFQWMQYGLDDVMPSSVGSVEDDQQQQQHAWDLRSLCLSNNEIEVVSSRMLSGTPWLQHLDLSNNRITDKWCLDSLDHLTHINLSYNHLESLPALSEVASRQLEVLILRNNFIDDISEILLFKNLRRLDLSHNLIDNFRTMVELVQLEKLQQIDLSGNPISYIRNYRLLASSCLRDNEATSNIMFDGKPLNKKEKEVMGKFMSGYSTGHLGIPRRPLPTSEELINDGAGSSNSRSRSRVSESSSLSKSSTSKKLPKVRVAVITDADTLADEERNQNRSRTDDQIQKQSDPASIREEINEGLRSFLEQIKDNKKALNSMHGSSIQSLHNTPCAVSGDLYGSPSNHGLNLLNTTGSDLFYSPVVNSADQSSRDFGQCVTPINSTYESLIDIETSNMSKEDLIIEKSILGTSLNRTIELDRAIGQEEKKTLAASDSNLVQDDKEEGEDVENENIADDNDDDEEDDAEDDDGDAILWLVQKVVTDNKKEEIFLLLKERELKEKDPVKGHSLVKWGLSTVQSCVKVSSEPPTIQLTFDTIRKNCTERTYIMESNDAQALLQKLGNVLESRPLKEMNQVVFRCMKCSAMFSQELKATIHKDNSRRCQACGSNLVIQMDEEEHLPSHGKSPTETAIEAKLSTSPSQCSIASECEGVVSVAFLAEVHMTNISQHEDNDSSYSAWSAASLDRSSSRESPANNGGGTIGGAKEGRGEGQSDIEVISNPSQSSIEIIEVQARLQAGGGGGGGGSTPPLRKRSSEERQAIAVVPQLITVPEVQNQSSTNLTESSSSGSLTDSICTTYENQAGGVGRRLASQSSIGVVTLPEETSAENSPSTNAQANAHAQPVTVPCPPGIESPLKSFNSLPNTNYASILEDLLQNVSSKLETPKQLNQEKTDDTVQYSYECFTNVDHRIKFFLFQSVFEEENEDLELLIRVTICDQKGLKYPGCFVMSNLNCFMIKIIGKETGDDASEFLQKECTLSLNKLKKMEALPWLQGVAVIFQDSWYLLLTQDVQRTRSFLQAIADARPSLPVDLLNEEDKSSSQLALSIQHVLLTAPSLGLETDVDAAVRIVSLPSTVNISRDKAPNETISYSSFGVTASDVFLLGSDVRWMLPSSTVKPLLHRKQIMSNLVDVGTSGSCLELHFLDESEGVEEKWKLFYVTREAVDNVLEAIRSPWEALFSVPLQINNTV